MKPVEALTVPCPICAAAVGERCHGSRKILVLIQGNATVTAYRKPHGQRTILAAVDVARAALEEGRA